MKKYVHIFYIEKYWKTSVARLRRLSKNVIKKYFMEVENWTGSDACPNLGLIVSGDETLWLTISLLISYVSYLSTL
jgi:hypothetical protein